MKGVYAILCVVGLLVPYFFFVPFLLDNGLNVPLLLEQMAANAISSFFAADVLVSSVVLWVFIYHQNCQRRVRLWWLSLLANVAVGVSLALPLFLLLREFDAEKA
jgi:hypothetical protein